MPVTVAPEAEACQALVDQINTGTAYTLPAPATYAYESDRQLEATDILQVVVISDESKTLEETMDVEDRTSHDISVRIIQRMPDDTIATVNSLLLIARQIWQRVNNFDSSDGRVRVWEADPEMAGPDVGQMRNLRLFERAIKLRVEVEASP